LEVSGLDVAQASDVFDDVWSWIDEVCFGPQSAKAAVAKAVDATRVKARIKERIVCLPVRCSQVSSLSRLHVITTRTSLGGTSSCPKNALITR
jgi:hypothetical protein